jgi:hypothetical protein
VGRQFILITPNSLGAGVEIGDDVKIHRLVTPLKRITQLLSFRRLLDPRKKGQMRIDEMMED